MIQRINNKTEPFTTAYRVKDIRWSFAIAGCLVTLLPALSAGSASAQTWNGSISNDWTVGANWNGGNVPTGAAGVVMNAGSGAILGVNGAASGVTSGFILSTDLTIQNGSTLISSIVGLASTVGSTATATVTAAGSQWITNGAISVGGTGAGTLNIQNSATVSANAGTILGLLASASGTLNVSNGGTLATISLTGGAGAAQANFDNATLRALASNFTFTGGLTAAQLNIGAGGLTVDTNGFAIGSNGFSGIGGLTTTGAGTLTLNGLSTYTGQTVIDSGSTLRLVNAGSIAASSRLVNNGTFDISGLTAAGSGIQTLAGSGTVVTGTKTLTLTNANDNFAGSLIGSGGLILAGGAQTLAGDSSTFTGATTVQAGTLTVNGNLGGSINVLSGGSLGGIGTVGNTTIDGGILAPGNSVGTLTVQGNLSLTAASTYMIAIETVSATRTNVTGTATLGGATVNAVFAPGAYVSRQYTILNAQGGLGGSTFGAHATTNLPASFTSSLSYDANNAYLNLTLEFTPPPPAGPSAPVFSPLNTNQANVANALINSFNTAGGIPLVFGALTPSGLTQVSGEVATGSQQTTFNAMSLFMNLMTDPFMGAPGAASVSAIGYADENQALAYAANRGRSPIDALMAIHAKAPTQATRAERLWSVWGAGYGGTQSTGGSSAEGANDTTSRVYGAAAGLDYRLAPSTLVGFSLGGAGTNYNVANGIGGGRSDMFQAGIYGRHSIGAVYLSGALAYGWQDISTDRTVLGNSYRANFDADALSARIESGYRVAFGSATGLTPYVAGQVISFWLPDYSEQTIGGVNTFALSYAEKNVTASRSELGLRGDTSFALQDAVLTLRGRAAWAHNFNADRSIAAIFQTLPVSGFIVNGAAQARDAALVSAGGDIRWANGFSIGGTFEGEFSRNVDSYAGKGVVRYQW